MSTSFVIGGMQGVQVKLNGTPN